MTEELKERKENCPTPIELLITIRDLGRVTMATESGREMIIEAVNECLNENEPSPAIQTCPTCRHPAHKSICQEKSAEGVFCFCGVPAVQKGRTPQPERCHACGMPAKKAGRLGNNKLMKPHKCPHGNPCAAGSPTAGLHTNHNVTCRACLGEVRAAASVENSPQQPEQAGEN